MRGGSRRGGAAKFGSARASVRNGEGGGGGTLSHASWKRMRRRDKKSWPFSSSRDMTTNSHVSPMLKTNSGLSAAQARHTRSMTARIR